MTTWTDQHLVASVLLLLPVALAALTVVSAPWWFAAVVPTTAVVPTLTAAQRRYWQVLSVPLRQPGLPGRPRPRAPGQH